MLLVCPVMQITLMLAKLTVVCATLTTSSSTAPAVCSIMFPRIVYSIDGLGLAGVVCQACVHAVTTHAQLTNTTSPSLYVQLFVQCGLRFKFHQAPYLSCY
jgi:hypothetical protein